MKLSDYKSPALVLSGGGIKAAAFHIGACLALKQLGFNFAGGNKEYVQENYELEDSSLLFKTYVGSSAGSVVCSFLAAGYSIESIIEAFTKGQGLPEGKNSSFSSNLKPLTYKDIFAMNVNASPLKLLSSFFRKTIDVKGGLEVMLKKSVKFSGLFNTSNLEKYIRENVVPHNNNFSDLGVKLFIVATQLNYSRKTIFGDFDKNLETPSMKNANFATISEACAASTSLPPVFSPYGITNQFGKKQHFFDGEIRDTLSTHIASDNGSDLVIASYSIQPYNYNEEMGSLHNYGIPLIINQALYQVVQQKIDSHIRYRNNIGEIISTIEHFFKENNLPIEQAEQLVSNIIKKTNHKRGVKYIYIHPSAHDYKMFFSDHFSLNPEILNNIVKTGYRSAIRSLKPYTIS